MTFIDDFRQRMESTSNDPEYWRNLLTELLSETERLSKLLDKATSESFSHERLAYDYILERNVALRRITELEKALKALNK